MAARICLAVPSEFAALNKACLRRPIISICVLQGVHAEHMILQPHPLHPLFFSERIAEIDPALSAALYEDLRAAGFVNATGYSDYLTIMLEDPDEEAARECVLDL